MLPQAFTTLQSPLLAQRCNQIAFRFQPIQRNARHVTAAASPSGAPSSSPKTRVGIIGAGQMGEALIRGFLDAGAASPGRICASVATFERREKLASLGIGNIFEDATEGGAAAIAENSDVIFLGVKPQIMSPILDSLAPVLEPHHLVISIAAGIKISTLEKQLGQGVRVVRVMPNTPCLVRSGASAYALGTHATQEDADLVHRLLSSVGLAIQVEEKMMDAVTGLSGSGPAYVFLMVEALADGGVAAGLPRDTALALAAKTVAGAAQMIFQEDDSSISGMVHPGILKDKVASPAGTTIAGLMELEASGVRGAFARAVLKAAKRSEELG
jgi:pyrroline-5-carboxylate reductase